MLKIRYVLLICAFFAVLTGCDASNPAVVRDDPPINTLSKDYFVGVAEGDVPDHVAWSVMGFNSAVGSTSEDIWLGGASYVFPTVAQ